MGSKSIALDLAAFLDSTHAQRVEGLGSGELRRFGEAILEACYEDLGVAPHLLDGESARELLLHRLPARLKRRDPLAARAGELLAAFLAHLRESQVVAHAFELGVAFDEHADGLRDAVETGAGVPAAPVKKADPFVHGAAKTGRNDPCFCGSGKKFKKCHGKA